MQQQGQKSLKINMILNAFKAAMSVIFPLITFPYVSHILGVDNIGKYNFSTSIISYFILISGLGISTYAIREGARIRDNREQIEMFSCEMFSINVIATVFSYLLLGLCFLLVPQIRDYRLIIIVLSIQIALKTIGVEWLYSIYEDYVYITVRSIAFQIISLLLLFIFVRRAEDIISYAMVTVVSSAGSNLLNFLHSRKYCRIKIIPSVDLKKHLNAILVLFAMSATVMIYVSSDITILGFLCGDYTVGIYSVSTKVYSIVKTILSSILVVSIPRLSSMLGDKNRDEFTLASNTIYKTLISIVLPAIIGIIVLRREIVLLISNEKFLPAISSLSLLSIALFFCMGAWFWGQCVLVPNKKDKVVFKATLVSALVNIVLNFLFIPIIKENAAAITTIIAEGIAFFLCETEGKKIVKIDCIWGIYSKVLMGCGTIFLVGFIVHSFNLSIIFNICLIIPCSIAMYSFTEILLNNIAFMELIQGMKRKMIRK